MLKRWSIGLLFIGLILVVAACNPNNENDNLGSNQMNNNMENEQNDVNDQNEINDQIEDNDQEADQDPVIEAESYEVWLYYADDELMDIYKVQTEIEAEDESMLPQLALDVWNEGPEHEGLVHLLTPNVTTTVERIEDDTVYVNFSGNVVEETNLGSTGEVFLLEQIAMVMEQFGYPKTFFLIDGEEVETFLGHMSLFVPIEAGDPDEYEIFE